MKKKFSLFEELETNIETINEIDDCIKITLGPTGKNGIVSNEKGEIKFITSGCILLNSLEFKKNSSNVILKLLEQASAKTYKVFCICEYYIIFWLHFCEICHLSWFIKVSLNNFSFQEKISFLRIFVIFICKCLISNTNQLLYISIFYVWQLLHLNIVRFFF